MDHILFARHTHTRISLGLNQSINTGMELATGDESMHTLQHLPEWMHQSNRVATKVIKEEVDLLKWLESESGI